MAACFLGKISSLILSSPAGFSNFGRVIPSHLSDPLWKSGDSFGVGFSLAYSADLPAVLRHRQFALLHLLEE
jgi:hypothetical protein